MSEENENRQFNIGEPVVYPQQGMGIVRDIKERVVNGNLEHYYDIYIEAAQMTILIPVSKAKELGMRHVVSKEEAQNAINNISSKAEPCPSDWKLRYQRSQALIKKGTIESIAKVVQTLYHRSKIKELPIQEKKLYENVLELLIDESAYAMNMEKEEISTLIISKLESK